LGGVGGGCCTGKEKRRGNKRLLEGGGRNRGGAKLKIQEPQVGTWNMNEIKKKTHSTCEKKRTVKRC